MRPLFAIFVLLGSSPVSADIVQFPVSVDLTSPQVFSIPGGYVTITLESAELFGPELSFVQMSTAPGFPVDFGGSQNPAVVGYSIANPIPLPAYVTNISLRLQFDRPVDGVFHLGQESAITFQELATDGQWDFFGAARYGQRITGELFTVPWTGVPTPHADSPRFSGATEIIWSMTSYSSASPIANFGFGLEINAIPEPAGGVFLVAMLLLANCRRRVQRKPLTK